jgi:hypothetical protein
METGLSRNRVISELSKSPHGTLSDYIPIGKKAVESDPQFFAHLTAWNAQKGQVRDAKVALPVINLMVGGLDEEFTDNALAHLAMLGPRELLRAFRFAKEAKLQGNMMKLRRLMASYLREKEQDRGWDHLAVQHRKTLKEMYGLLHVKPSKHADNVLFKSQYAKGSIFEAVANLKSMSPAEAASEITTRKIPFLIAFCALGEKAKEPDLVLALINRMSPTELVTNAKMLEKLGMNTNPALRGAYANGLERVAKSGANVLKTSRAAENVKDEGLREKIRGAQDKQVASMGPEGDWLVLADKSGSMSAAIEVARHVAGTLAGVSKGKVYLTFFDDQPHTVDVTGLPLDVIQKATKHIRADGGTSIGVGLNRLLTERVEVDGIVIVSDAAENTPPFFADVYNRYVEQFSKDVPVYLYRVGGTRVSYSDRDLEVSMKSGGHEMQVFHLGSTVDYYSLPNTIQTLRASRYSLVDEILATPLVALKDVLKHADLVAA